MHHRFVDHITQRQRSGLDDLQRGNKSTEVWELRSRQWIDHVARLEEGCVGVDECCFGKEPFARLLVVVLKEGAVQSKSC